MRIIGAMSMPWTESCVYFCRLSDSSEIMHIAKGLAVSEKWYADIICAAVRMDKTLRNTAESEKLYEGVLAGVLCRNGICSAENEETKFGLLTMYASMNMRE